MLAKLGSFTMHEVNEFTDEAGGIVRGWTGRATLKPYCCLGIYEQGPFGVKEPWLM